MTQPDENGPESPPAGGDEGQPKSELSELLQEFKNANTADDKLDPVIQFAKSEMAAKEKQRLDNDINSAVEVIRGADESLKDVKPKLIQGIMEAYARENPNFVKAFEGRGDNPEAWKTALVDGSKFAVELLSDFAKPSDRDDVEAAQAAVDGTSTEPASSDAGLSGPELRALSDVEFRQRLAEEVAKSEMAG